MADRHLLHLGHTGLVVHRWRNGQLDDETRFGPDSSGINAFSAHLATILARSPRTRFTLIVDLADEAFHLEILPRLHGRDRRQLIARRQAQLHLDTPYITHLSLGRETTGRHDERLLFVALTRPAALHPWLNALQRANAVLTGVHCAALLGPALLRQIPDAPATALLATLGANGLRISCIDRGALFFSRLVPGRSATETGLWHACRDEIQRTFHYLLGQRLLERGTPTTAFIVAQTDQHTAIRAACPDSPELRFIPVDPSDLAHRCGLRASHPDADTLHLHLAARTRRQAQLAPPAELHQQRLAHAGTAIGVIAASLLSLSLVVATRNILDARQLRDQTAAIRNASLAEEASRAALVAATPSLPISAAALKTDLTRMAALQGFASGPESALRQLSAILEPQPEIRLLSLDWTAEPSAPDSGTQNLRIEVALPPADERRIATRLLDSLRNLPKASVAIEQSSSGIDAEIPLRAGSIPATPEAGRLGIRIKLPTP